MDRREGGEKSRAVCLCCSHELCGRKGGSWFAQLAGREEGKLSCLCIRGDPERWAAYVMSSPFLRPTP